MRRSFSKILVAILFAALAVSLAHTSLGQTPIDDDDVVDWRKPMEPISETESDKTLVLLLITNDEPIAKRDQDNKEAARPVYGWCTEVFADSFRAVRRLRPDLRTKVSLQWLPVGLPPELTGGRVDNGTARSVVLLCDGQYRLLSFLVGVPDATQLQTLIEDGQEYQSMRDLGELRRDEIVAAIANRNSQRINRMWRSLLEENVIAMEGNVGDAPDPKAAIDDDAEQRISVLNERFGDAYLADVRLRFDVKSAADAPRLTTLEQHIETRRPWCECMTPFLAGVSMEKNWATLVEWIWGHQPIQGEADEPEWINQISALGKTETFVFSVRPPLMFRHLPWPPPTGDTTRAGEVWNRVHALATSAQYREIDLQQLYEIVRSSDMPSINVRGSSLLRYVILPAGKNKLLPVFQDSNPGRVAGLLKRIKTDE
ncbi:hypothetical protein Poly51_06090 [Rubripirellula tenax]|uniref:Secreted protein n=1 Tax=Rubripirellula tenax TaxID=2528015 RepID=A0A5C6FKM9_9BACT|nr:hypothetical protein [Rubripirellula tenax]TWU60334.1 hypothetical protein Poly51_06090 [Rubripirellula tenax]